VDAVGESVGTSAAHPEALLSDYDVVFAKGRCAIEALVTGTAVVLCDAAGVGPMVTTAELDRLRRLNFGIRTLQERVTPDAIARELLRYDPRNAALVSQQLRATAGSNAAVTLMAMIHALTFRPHAAMSRHSPPIALRRWHLNVPLAP